MADLKISAAPAVVTPAPTDEYATNQGGVDRKTNRAQMHVLQSGEHFILPQVSEPLTPTFAFGDGNSGFYEDTDNELRVSLNGVEVWRMGPTFFGGAGGSTPVLIRETPSLINPTLVPSSSDLDTGIGGDTNDALGLIAGGVSGLILDEASGGVLQVPNANLALTADVGSIQGGGVITSSYNVYSVVANVGDAATLPATFLINSLVYIKNDGANSMDVFPALGDNAGAGVNTAVAVAAGESITFIGTVANSIWSQLIKPPGGAGADPSLLGNGTAGAPSYSFTNSPTTGLFRPSADVISIAHAGVELWKFQTLDFGSAGTGGPLLKNIVPGSNVPNIVSKNDDQDTGIGAGGVDIMTLVAGGVEGARIAEAAGVVQLIVPAQNDAANPSIAFGVAENDGFYQNAAGEISVAITGIRRFAWIAGAFQGVVAGSPALLNEDGTGTNPNIVPDGGDVDTGIGGPAPDQLSLIAGGLTCISVRETAGARQIGFYDGSPVSLQTGVAVTASAIHAALVALRLITA